MIKLGIFAVGLALSSLSFADETKVVGDQKFVTKSGDTYGQLCMAALDSKYVLLQRAEELGVSKVQLKDVTCNGLSLVRFAKTYRGDIQEWFIAHRD